MISRIRRKKLALMENLHATRSNPRSISNFTPSRFPIGCTAFLSRLSGGRFLVRQSGRLVSCRLVSSLCRFLFLSSLPPLVSSSFSVPSATCTVRRQRRRRPPTPLAFLFILVQAVTSRSPLPPASPSDGAVFVQARAAQRLVARAGQCGALGGRVSLYPHLWHGLRLSVVSTPYLRPPPNPPPPPSTRSGDRVTTLLSNRSQKI